MQLVKSYGLAKTWETLEKNVLSTCIKWQEKTDRECQHTFTANWRWQIKNNPEFGAPGPAETSTFHVI